MRIRSLIAGAALVATATAAFILPAQSALAEADGFMRCFHLVVPVTDGVAAAGVWDYENMTPIQNHFTFNETNSTMDYYFPVSDGQYAYANSTVDWGTGVGYDWYGAMGWKSSSNVIVEEVAWDFCDGSIMDGRLNASDLGALAYVYPDTDGYSVWELNLGDMKGYQQFAVSAADIAAAIVTANETGVNQQIGATTERGTTLWALVGGQCQLNHFEQDGKINAFAFDCAL